MLARLCYTCISLYHVQHEALMPSTVRGRSFNALVDMPVRRDEPSHTTP